MHNNNRFGLLFCFLNTIRQNCKGIFVTTCVNSILMKNDENAFKFGLDVSVSHHHDSNAEFTQFMMKTGADKEQSAMMKYWCIPRFFQDFQL